MENLSRALYMGTFDKQVQQRGKTIGRYRLSQADWNDWMLFRQRGRGQPSYPTKTSVAFRICSPACRLGEHTNVRTHTHTHIGVQPHTSH